MYYLYENNEVFSVIKATGLECLYPERIADRSYSKVIMELTETVDIERAKKICRTNKVFKIDEDLVGVYYILTENDINFFTLPNEQLSLF